MPEENRPYKQTCPVCGGLMDHAFSASPLDYIVDRSFPVLVCAGCGHGVTAGVSGGEPQPEGLYEGGNYDPKERFWHRAAAPILRILEKGKLGYLKGRKGGRLLEVGCGKGRFLEAARRAGYDAFGIEPSMRSFLFARGRLGDAVFRGGLDDIGRFQAALEPFDVIVLWHVLEHLADPGEAVDRIRERLAPGGVVLMAMPNMSSFQARVGKADWYHLDPPRHVHHFTPASLSILLEKRGFRVLRRFDNSFYQNLVGEVVTSTNRLLPMKNVLFNTLRLNELYLKRAGRWSVALFAAAAALSLAILLPAAVWALISGWIGRAGTMVFLAGPAEGEAGSRSQRGIHGIDSLP